MGLKCAGCRDGEGLGFAITTAFRPIVDLQTGTAFAYEALVRGAEGVESPGELEALRKIGIRYGQGHYLARPAAGQLPQIRQDIPLPKAARAIFAEFRP